MFQVRVKAEFLIREESVVVGYEMLACLCELLLARFSLVETEKRLPPDLKVTLKYGHSLQFCIDSWQPTRT